MIVSFHVRIFDLISISIWNDIIDIENGARGIAPLEMYSYGVSNFIYLLLIPINLTLRVSFVRME